MEAWVSIMREREREKKGWREGGRDGGIAQLLVQ